ncbi:nucleoside 2-deoxyribosyltransferase [candidate division KSB1 bacterium]|nr:nucleoside 2-deoxyribosyltransferase [candidate division KSB1 bacterium]
MNIYFAGSISGGRRYLQTYQEMVRFLKSSGHLIYTEHIVDPHVLQHEERLTALQIYERDMAWLAQCDCLIAEISNPSLGVGYEVCAALNLNKPTLCLYHHGLFVSRMLTGNNRSGLVVQTWKEAIDWQTHIEHFMLPLSV